LEAKGRSQIVSKYYSKTVRGNIRVKAIILAHEMTQCSVPTKRREKQSCRKRISRNYQGS
jgi:hypothetical protein